jgi:hypothetical protein
MRSTSAVGRHLLCPHFSRCTNVGRVFSRDKNHGAQGCVPTRSRVRNPDDPILHQSAEGRTSARDSAPSSSGRSGSFSGEPPHRRPPRRSGDARAMDLTQATVLDCGSTDGVGRLAATRAAPTGAGPRARPERRQRTRHASRLKGRPARATTGYGNFEPDAFSLSWRSRSRSARINAISRSKPLVVSRSMSIATSAFRAGVAPFRSRHRRQYRCDAGQS